MKKLLKSPVFWGILAVLLVVAPQIRHYRFVGTDCTHLAVLQGLLERPGMGPLTLYCLADGVPEHTRSEIAKGQVTWYTNPYQKIKFLRHFSSAITVMGYKIFALNPLGHGFHTLLWYLLLTILMGLLARRVCLYDRVGGAPLDPGSAVSPPGSPASAAKPETTAAAVNRLTAVPILTVLIYAFAARNIPNFLYGSARWLFVAAAISIIAILLHVKWREENWKPGRFLAPAAALLALLTGEASLAVLSYLFAYELFGSGEPLKKRLKALLPYAALVFVYLIFYKVMGYGSAGQDQYLNPLHDPIAYIMALPAKLAAMIGEMFAVTMTFFRIHPQMPGKLLLTFLVGAAALTAFVLLFLPAWKQAPAPLQRRFKWLIFGTIGAMLPLSSAAAATRVVLFLSIGGAILLAFILDSWGRKLFQKAKLRKHLKSPVAYLGALCCLGLIFLHLINAPYRWWVMPKYQAMGLDTMIENHEKTEFKNILPTQAAVFLKGGWWWNYVHRKFFRLPMPAVWRQLSPSFGKHRYLRTAEDTLELKMVSGGIFDPPDADVSAERSSKTPLKTGEVIDLPGLRITVLEVNQNGPTRVEFKFDRPLEDEGYRFFKENDEELILNIELPQVGKSIEI
ncbi:MAG: hypothetical protein KAW12_23305 [Candidatus Aminicenantes bacterium]|nr:hypothetical protein [Candidatus Aminicenantes bacterium]